MLLSVVLNTVARANLETKITQHSGMIQATSQTNRVCGQKQMMHLRRCWIPIAGRPATGKSVVGIVNLFVDDLFGTGGTEMEQRVLARLRKDFQVGSVTFTGQRIRWIKDSQSGRCSEVSQQEAVDELEEIPVERKTKEDLHCIPAMHTRNGSLLVQINWLQSRTQFQCCYNFSRSASKAASPTIGDVKVFLGAQTAHAILSGTQDSSNPKPKCPIVEYSAGDEYNPKAGHVIVSLFGSNSIVIPKCFI